MIYQFEWPKIETCVGCPLLDSEQGCFCVLTDKPVRKSLCCEAPRPEWCPLEEK